MLVSADLADGAYQLVLVKVVLGTLHRYVLFGSNLSAHRIKCRGTSINVTCASPLKGSEKIIARNAIHKSFSISTCMQPCQ